MKQHTCQLAFTKQMHATGQSPASDTSSFQFAQACDAHDLISYCVASQGGRTPLHLAALQGKIGVMKQLLDARAPANAADEHGMTPLHKAAVGGRTEAAQLLLNAGASYNARLKVATCCHAGLCKP